MINYEKVDFKRSLTDLSYMIVEQTGKKVRFDKGEPRTDGTTIILPFVKIKNQQEWNTVEGFLIHEAAHCKHTNFNFFEVAVRKKPYLKYIINLFEDVRVDRKIGAEFPGSMDKLRRNRLDDLLKPCLTDGTLLDVLNWAYYHLFVKLFRLSVAEIVETTALLRASAVSILGTDTMQQLDTLLDKVLNSASTEECIKLAEDFFLLIQVPQDQSDGNQEEQSKGGENSPSENGESGPAGQRGEDSSSARPDANPDSNDGQSSGKGQQGSSDKPEPGTGSDPGNDEGKEDPAGTDSDDGQSSGKGQQGSSDKPEPGAGSDQEDGESKEGPAGSDQNGGQSSKPETAQTQGEQTDTAGTSNGSGFSLDANGRMFDPESLAYQPDAGMQRIMSMEQDDFSNEDLPPLIRHRQKPVSPERVLPYTKAFSCLRQAVIGEVWKRRGEFPNGARLNKRRLVQTRIGQADRAFLGPSRIKELNTFVYLLVDCSGSMCGPRMDSANLCLNGLRNILHGVQGITIDGAGFTAEWTPDTNGLLLFPYPEGKNQGFYATGGTPILEALRFARYKCDAHPLKRRIIILLTDGDVPHEYGSEVRSLVQQYQKERIETVGIFIGGIPCFLPLGFKAQQPAEIANALKGIWQRLLYPETFGR